MKLSKTAGSDRKFVPDPNDRFRYGATTTYTPAALKRIFDDANSGDTERLCLCGREMLERNWDIIGALEQRANALLGVGYDVQPRAFNVEEQQGPFE